MGDLSVINIGELSKPAAILIEKISNAVGGIFQPYQIRRVARAEADAAIIKAEAEIQMTELQRKAVFRFLEEEARKQQNIENITRRAIPCLEDSANPGAVEDDWISNFFDKCRIVSGEEMQELWSKILVSESNRPGSVARKTVNLLADIDKNDAEIFSLLCGYCWTIGERIPVVYDPDDDIYKSNGLSFSRLKHLESLGLIHFDSFSGFGRVNIPELYQVSYGQDQVTICNRNGVDYKLDIGKVIFTRAGHDIVKVCNAPIVPGFAGYVKEKWRKAGLLHEHHEADKSD